MQTAQLKAAAPACAAPRPAMAARSAFKAGPAPSVARPSFARRVQKLQKASGVQARNVVVVRAADDKVSARAASPRRLWRSRRRGSGVGRPAGGTVGRWVQGGPAAARGPAAAAAASTPSPCSHGRRWW